MWSPAWQMLSSATIVAADANLDGEVTEFPGAFVRDLRTGALERLGRDPAGEGEELAELLTDPLHLAEQLQRVARQRLLEPVDIQPLVLTSRVHRPLEAPHRRIVAAGVGITRCLVAVDQDVEVVSHGLAHQLDDADVVAECFETAAQLDRLPTVALEARDEVRLAGQIGRAHV